MCELRRGTLYSRNNYSKLKMANQTEESNRRRIQTQAKIINQNLTAYNSSTNPGSSNPGTSTGDDLYDLNNNVTTNVPPPPPLPQEPQPSAQIRNERKRSSDNGTGIMKKFKWTLALTLLLSIIQSIRGEPPGNSIQNWDRPAGMPNIDKLEVMCGAQHMEVHLTFDAPFHGLVASKGMYGQSGCVYVPPRSGRTTFAFNIYYDKCGTKPDNHGKFYENTVVVQYDEELIEAWDEAKRLRCEWFNDYEKTATKTSPMVISDLEIVELNFHGDNVDCWMEIQEGKGPWAPPLNGIVPLGSPLTMVVAVKDPTGEFDMRVKACEASDGQGGHVLPLSDADGCIVRPKLLGKFSKVKLDDGKATVLTYAYISAFKFPDMLNVHLRCSVEICRHGCPNHCSSEYHIPQKSSPPHNFLDPMPFESQRNPTFSRPNDVSPPEKLPKPAEPHTQPQPPPHLSLQLQKLEQELRPQFQNEPSVSMVPPSPLPDQRPGPQGRPSRPPPSHIQRPGPPPHIRQPHQFPPGKGRPPKYQRRRPRPHSMGPHRQGLPQGEDEAVQEEMLTEDVQPRKISEEANQTVPEENGGEAPRPLAESNAQELKAAEPAESESNSGFPKGPRQLTVRRRRRSVFSNSDIVGIEGAFRVISQADLNFALNMTSSSTSRPAAVLNGRIRSEETVYGVCLPRLGFGIVFFGLGLATVVSILIAGFFAYSHYKATVSNKAMGHSVMIGDGHGHPPPPGLTPHPVFPMVILRHFW